MGNQDMSDLIKNFSQMLNEGNIPDNVKEVFNNLSSNSSNNNQDTSNDTSSSNIDFETIMKMKSIMEKLNSKDDPRANLLLSLKPYLKESRKNKVEQYIKLFNMSKAFDVFGGFGGDSKK